MTGTGAYSPIHNKEAKCCHNRIKQLNVSQLTALPRLASTVQSSMKETVGSLVVGQIHAAYLASTQSRKSKRLSIFTESHSYE